MDMNRHCIHVSFEQKNFYFFLAFISRVAVICFPYFFSFILNRFSSFAHQTRSSQITFIHIDLPLSEFRLYARFIYRLFRRKFLSMSNPYRHDLFYVRCF